MLSRLAILAFFFVTRPPEIAFDKSMIDGGAAEPAAFADINGDKRLDIMAGEFWYEAPNWTPHRFRTLPFLNNYVDDFSDLVADYDGDGKLDVVSVGWFSKNVSWWKNPGTTAGEWKRQDIETKYNVEFAFLVDADSDGKALEILPQFGNGTAPLTWYEFKGGAWQAHVVSPKSYGHGIGAGDVNGDKRTDIVTPKGWFEAPADPRNQPWIYHSDFDLGDTGFLHVLDVNGDGRADIVTSMAHNYGIFWLEQGSDGKWVKHLIDDSWSQGHATVLVDLNQDGRLDLLTGKRYMAHNGKDPGEREPLGVYWYENAKDDKGEPMFVRHVIDYSTRTGGGMQIAVADINGDGRPDLATGGKSGLFLFKSVVPKK
ncbi:FG-GAP repeat domain-containing protein [Paludibaculum fermentans]|uniref:FG-GAP repeat domain-containing protein n=1 Tax=Paludibaculum fermentans TaxID=1473598 RepID=UPI003EBA78C9